ncbi:MAG: fumarylacetoacetate hydrolase family protein [Ornithinimicrobium sp.]
MNLVGVIVEDVRMVAVRSGDRLDLLGPVDTFWSDPGRSLANRGGTSIPTDGANVTHPVPDSARILCLGLNYRAHASEGNFSAPDHPVIFGRWTASLVTDGASVAVPPDEDGLDWEGEVAAVIGQRLNRVDPDTARAAVLAYAPFNDLTARRAQKLTSQWTLGKNADLSGPMGDLVTADEVGDLRDGLHLQTIVNGEVVQDGNTRDMIFEAGEVLSRVSQIMTLNPGDILVTGTPEGVGYVRTPPWLLSEGDRVTVTVERLGSVSTTVVGSTPLT